MRSDLGTQPDRLTLSPIGYIRTPFSDRYEAPRQPGVSAGPEEGVIELLPDRNFEQAVADLDGFDRIWVISWFHRNTTWKPRVLPPRGPRTKRGLFATRSPHRPNPIGLSLLSLLEVRGRTLRVADVDLLDGTPVLDIKPYLPYAEAFPDANSGWLDAVIEEEIDAAGPLFEVVWSDYARAQCEWLRAQFDIDLASHAGAVLSIDPSPHPYRRIRQLGADRLEIAMKSWRVIYKVDRSVVLVERIASGYPAERIRTTPPDQLHDDRAHRAFLDEWR